MSVCLSPLLKNESISVGALEEEEEEEEASHTHTHTHGASTLQLDGKLGIQQTGRLSQKQLNKTVSPLELKLGAAASHSSISCHSLTTAGNTYSISNAGH